MQNYERYRAAIGLNTIGNQRLPAAPIRNPFMKGRDPMLADRLKTSAEE